MSPPIIGELFQGLQAFAAVAGMVFAGLAYWKGRENNALGKQTHNLVDGQGARLEAVAQAAGYRQGVVDQAGGAAPAPYPPAPELKPPPPPEPNSQ